MPRSARAAHSRRDAHDEVANRRPARRRSDWRSRRRIRAALKTTPQRDGWSANQMNIILQGAFLQDSKTVAECGLKDGDFVVITGMVSRDMRRPAGEAEGPLREMPDEMSPFLPAPVVLSELPTEQRIERT